MNNKHHKFALALAAAVIAAQTHTAASAATITWNAPVNGFWEVPANWDTAGTPTATDFAWLPFVVDVSSTAAGNTAQELTNNSRLNVSSGDLSIVGTITNTGSVMTMTGGHAFVNRILNGAGAIVVSTDAGSVLKVTTGIFNNALGRVRASSDGQIIAGSINNSGVVDAITGGDIDLTSLFNVTGGSAEAQGLGSTIEVTDAIANQTFAKLVASDKGKVGGGTLDNSGLTLAITKGEIKVGSVLNFTGGLVQAQDDKSKIKVDGAIANQVGASIVATTGGEVTGGSLANFGLTLAHLEGKVKLDSALNHTGALVEAQDDKSKIKVDGAITNQVGATVAATVQGKVEADSLDNSGHTLILTGGNLELNSLQNNNSGGVDVQDNGSEINVAGTAHNFGFVGIANNAKLQAADYVQDNGITQLTNGTLQANNVGFNFGSVQGEGTIIGQTLVNAGAIIAPGLGGNDAGEIDINGNFTLNGTGLFEIGALSSFDVIDSTGVVSLGGPFSALSVSLFNSYDPNVGDFFDIITGSSVGGSFTNLLFPFLTGKAFSVAYLADRVRLQIIAAAPVPLPPSVWLMLSALLGVGFVGRRRRQAHV